MNRKYINIELKEETIKNLDIIAEKLVRKRKQVIELLLENLVKHKIENGDYSL